jgi:YHS domain-containing protein
MVRILLAFLVCMSLTGAFTISFAENMQDPKQNITSTEQKNVENINDLGMCPVMGGKALKEYSYTHEGEVYYFCCPGCIESFKKDPEKYISKV